MLTNEFYQRGDVVQIAKELLGKLLVTTFNGEMTSGIITEIEAYAGVTDKGSHAYGGRRTKRTETMYYSGGVAYVYLCYGIHHLFNVVTNVADVPHAVLVRGIEPIDGIDIMLKRRNKSKFSPQLTAGPGVLSMALGIATQYTGHSLQSPEIYIKDIGKSMDDRDIITGTRVGVAYAEDDAYLPYRFSIKDNPFVSKGKGL